MQKIDQAVLIRASRAWREACRELEVKIVAPFSLGAERTSVTCLAFLPDFGGPKGMVVGGMDLPETTPDERLGQMAKEKGLYFSSVNVSAFASRNVAQRIFKEALEDWGYFGPPQGCPRWFKGHKADTRKLA